MEKKRIEKLLRLLREYRDWSYPEPLGTSEESDLHSVIYDVEYTLKNYEGLVTEESIEGYIIRTATGSVIVDSFEELLEKIDFLISKRFFTIESIELIVEK